MRIGIQAWGSEGDVRPLLGLAGSLRSAGHDVHVDVTALDGTDYAALCHGLGVSFRAVPERMPFSLQEIDAEAARLDPLKLSRRMVEEGFYPFVDELYEAALALCERSDVVVWHYSSWYTKAAALKVGTPDVAVHFFPGLAPSRRVPPAGLPNCGPLNGALWLLARTALDMQFRRRPAHFFADHGLPPLRHVLPDLLFSTQLNLHAISPMLCPAPSDWGPEHQVCGQLTVDTAQESWTPSPELRAFLEDGPKPALLCLGSMEHFAPKRARDLLVAAARLAGVRAIVQSKRGGAGEGRDRDVYHLPWAPHRAVLPHCSLMLHHGGAGTTHTAARAGVPSVVVPFILEQSLWADRLRKTGASGKALSFWKATPEKLAPLIREATTSKAMRTQAEHLGHALSAENGNRAAIRLLETLAEK